MHPWPPPYTLRISARAKQMRLQISSGLGLQVVVPHSVDINLVPNFMMQHRRWIEKHLAKALLQENPHRLPDAFQLRGIDEIWNIIYLPNRLKRLSLCEKESENKKALVVSGRIDLPPLVQKALTQWLCHKGRQHLLPWLDELSVKTGFSYQRATVRFTKTRWGSCSSKQTISLNAKLLFLPPELVEHVMLHELCHTQYLNHSKRFWRLLESLNPGCQTFRKALRLKAFQLWDIPCIDV